MCIRDSLDVDYLIVEKTNTAKNGDIVVALIDDSVTVKTFFKENGHIRLQPENDDMDPIIVDDCTIVGKAYASVSYTHLDVYKRQIYF